MKHDTLKSANILRKAGFPDEQAQAMVTVMTDNLATKEDIENLRCDTKRDMKDLGTSIRNDMKSLRRDMNDMGTSIRNDMKEDIKSLSGSAKETNAKLDYQLMILKWMGAFIGSGMLAIMVAAVAIVIDTVIT